MSDKAREQPVSHEAIAEQFQSLRSQNSQLSSSVNDISAELAEHQAVIKALEQLNPSRKCFRLVGEVLVERTVQEVLPAVKNNTEQLEMVSSKLRQQLDEKRKELADFQSKYKIRIRTEADVAAESQKAASDGPSKTQGVLA